MSRLLPTERRARGTRALTCWYQALLVLVWFRKNEDKTLHGTGFGVSRATAYRYVAEGIKVLLAQAPDLHEALKRVADEGWSHVILDGKPFATDRLAETTTSIKGDTIDAWYSGKHRDFGANIQAVMRPDGLPVWTSDAAPGHLHDWSSAQLHGIPGALYWAASQLHLPTLADTGYEGAGRGIHTPFKQPADGARLAPDNRAYNALLRAKRAPGERGFALLTGRWRSLRHTTASPRTVADIVRADLVLAHFEYRYLRLAAAIARHATARTASPDDEPPHRPSPPPADSPRPAAPAAAVPPLQPMGLGRTLNRPRRQRRDIGTAPTRNIAVVAYWR